ncbi:enoyl-CoA hydratase [Solimonas aquatica]|uniref:Enoyl-CoA hydratase n=1 Tax=Solimonas aquatica TaxID=489703 RepID=A0A1H9GDB6_9GAMM|nr:enoyl-CoA hydratase-related protein [Solimonas aquatica]SEQ48076.1 enoyl-CoA hydratase [Solimonas aquatica]
MNPSVLLERPASGIALLKLNRPEARNALTLAAVRELRAQLQALEQDRDCRVLLLAGQGRGFCAGLDLKTSVFGAEAARNATEAMALQELFAGTVAQLRRLPQPIVAAVQGAAVGAGFGLALAADVRIAAASANFLVGAVKIGLSAGECGISYHLPRLIGAGRAFEIMLSGRAVAAEEALSIGLVSRCVAEDALLDSALQTALAIAANSPYSVKHTKQLMWRNLDAPSLEAALELENHVQTVAMLSGDFKEGAQAFAEKRPPQFKGI